MAGESRELPAAAIEALTKGQKIEAIKIVRQDWGLGLREAKDAVEVYVAARPMPASQAGESNQEARWIWLVVVVGAILLFLHFFRG
jgi:ribosomal protein L7/L12